MPPGLGGACNATWPAGLAIESDGRPPPTLPLLPGGPDTIDPDKDSPCAPPDELSAPRPRPLNPPNPPEALLLREDPDAVALLTPPDDRCCSWVRWMGCGMANIDPAASAMAPGDKGALLTRAARWVIDEGAAADAARLLKNRSAAVDAAASAVRARASS